MLHSLIDVSPAPPSGPGPNAATAAAAAAQGGGAAAAGIELNTRPVIGLFLLVAFLFALRVLKDAATFAAERDKSRFREVDLTLWNVAIVSLMVIPGIVFWKAASVRFLNPRNPVRTLINAV